MKSFPTDALESELSYQHFLLIYVSRGSSSSSSTYFSIRIYIHRKKIQFSITEINIEIKTTATAAGNKKWVKVFSNLRESLWEGIACNSRAKTRGVIPFIWFSKGLVY